VPIVLLKLGMHCQSDNVGQGFGCRRKMLLAGVLALVFGWVCLPARPFLPVKPIPDGIVDMRCHIAGPIRHMFLFDFYFDRG